MSAPRFYVPAPVTPGQAMSLPEAAAHHALRVLRLAAGDVVTLFDGHGGEYPARIVTAMRDTVTLSVGTHCDIERESTLCITLAQGISRGERMDYTVQKATELGVVGIVPLATARSEVRLEGERALRRRDHWQSIVTAACAQCGRNRVPPVLPVERMTDWLARPGPATTRLVLDPDASDGLRGITFAAPIVLLVGPEGGLTPDEIAAARTRGYRSVRLGPRILRTETAALAALVALQTQAGDFD